MPYRDQVRHIMFNEGIMKNTLTIKEAIDRETKEIKDISTEISKLESKLRFHKEKVSKLQNKLNKIEGRCYYVYIVFVNGEPKYVGKGTGDRYKHAISGASSVAQLNKDFFNEDHIEVRILYGNKSMTEEQAIQEEKNVIGSIAEIFDIYNKTLPKEKDYNFMDCDFWDYSHFAARNKNYEFPRDVDEASVNIWTE